MKKAVLSVLLLLMAFMSLSGCIVVWPTHYHDGGYWDDDGHRGGGGRGRH